MGDVTPELAIPYPVGSDAVRDGDNYMQALAERVAAILTEVHSAQFIKVTTWDDMSMGSSFLVVDQTRAYVHVPAPGALVHLAAGTYITDALILPGESNMWIATRIDDDDSSATTTILPHAPASDPSTGWVKSAQWRYFPEGDYPVYLHMAASGAFPFDINSVWWQGYAFGAAITIDDTP